MSPQSVTTGVGGVTKPLQVPSNSLPLQSSHDHPTNQLSAAADDLNAPLQLTAS